MSIDKDMRNKIKQQVYRSVKKALQNETNDFEYRLQLKIAKFHERASYIEKRLIDIESMIHNHAIGVQNVYTELIQIKEFFKLAKMDADIIEKIERIKEIIE